MACEGTGWGKGVSELVENEIRLCVRLSKDLFFAMKRGLCVYNGSLIYEYVSDC